MEAITNKPIISCPKCGKTMIRIPNPSTEVGVGQKLFEKIQTHVYKTRGCVDRAENGVSYIFFQYCFTRILSVLRKIWYESEYGV